MDIVSRCEGCGQPLEPTRRGHRYHDGRCRKAAWLRRQHEREEIPRPGISGPTLDREAVLEAALAEDAMLVFIARAARTSWRAAAWVLEHRYPERYGSRAEPETSATTHAEVARILSLVPPPSA